MFKKIVYSAMALSMTLLPVSEVMAAEISTVSPIASGSYTVGSGTGNYTWTSGSVVNNGGTLQIVGYTPTSTATPNYTQTAGAFVLTGTTDNIASFTLQGTSSTAASITGGSVAIGGASGTKSVAFNMGNYSTIGSGATIGIGQGNTLNINGTNASVTLGSASTQIWEGDVALSNGSLTLTNAAKVTSGNEGEISRYNQTGGTLNLLNGSHLSLYGTDDAKMVISGGDVNVGSASSKGNALTVGVGGKVDAAATVKVYEGNTIELKGNASSEPSLTLNSGDVWQGTIQTKDEGYLLLDGYTNNPVTNPNDANLIYKQEDGTRGGLVLGKTSPSSLFINNPESYIDGGPVLVNSGSSLVIAAQTTATTSSGEQKVATLGEAAYLNLAQGSSMALTGTGSAVINDTVDAYDDEWNGEVYLGLGTDTPTLTLRNVTKDFTSEDESAVLIQNSGILNIAYGSEKPNMERGGSHITTTNLYSYETTDDSGETVTVTAPNLNGMVNIIGYDNNNKSSLTINYVSDDNNSTAPNQTLNLYGNADLTLNTNEHTVTRTTNIPTGVGANNTVNKTGTGYYNVGNGTDEVKMGYNMNVKEGVMNVTAPKVQIGINDGSVNPYGSLSIGTPTSAAIYATNAANTTVVDSLAMNYGGLVLSNPKGKMAVGGDFTVGSGIGSFNQVHMMNKGMNNINIAGTTTINDTLDVQIDVDPQKYGTLWQANDRINSTNVVQTKTGRLNLSNYRLLSQPTRDFYRFNVVNASKGYTTVGGENKTVSGRAARLIPTYVGNYTMIPSSAKGAFDMVLIDHNPEIFRGQVAAEVIYANQQVINNQLFDRMVYSILPYFNGKCTNKTASADTTYLYSPYQYSMTDPGLWFKPYANFETIHMTHGLGKVRNSAYGAMIGADFKKAQWGNWSFIPSAYIGYNGGRTTFNGVGMWHNGGQAGLMGTLTNGNFITMANIYGGGYYNSMNMYGGKDNNALWNAGVGSKTLYNIHLPWDFILQPSLYMSYNYVGASSFTGGFDGMKHKIDPLNAFSIAPGLNLIWQKETFSIYALFQAMFNIGSTVSGTIAEIDLPHVGIRDPYFEYGLGASKYFLNRFSGYGQVVARSGSRKGVGFQLGLNLKI